MILAAFFATLALDVLSLPVAFLYGAGCFLRLSLRELLFCIHFYRRAVIYSFLWLAFNPMSLCFSGQTYIIFGACTLYIVAACFIY